MLRLVCCLLSCVGAWNAPLAGQRQVLSSLRRAAASLLALTISVGGAAAAERSGVQYTKSPSGIGFYDYPQQQQRGSEEARLGSKVVLEVKGYLAGRNGWGYLDTTASDDEDDVVRLTLGSTPAIRGLELGLLGESPIMPAMHKGDKRRLIIPSRLGYISKDQQPIPKSEDSQRRLYSTVLNQQRAAVESRALGGDSVVGELVLDVQVVRLKNKER